MSTIVITGASSGIGAIAAARLSEQGWDVAVVGRNAQRTRDVASSVGGTAFLADYDRFDDVRELAAALLERYPRIDVLANNAGGLVPRRGATADGNERTIQHNHLAPFLLTSLLLPRLTESAGRVIHTSSVAHRWGRLHTDNLNRTSLPYLAGWPEYGSAKLATLLFARELAHRTGIQSYSFHPGFVGTSFGHDSPVLRTLLPLSTSVQVSPDAGAAPIVQLASLEPVGAPNGSYFDGLNPGGRTSRQAKDDALAARLWDATEALIAQSPTATRPV
ncbi:SDR family NAD(P)-dependent oxidoreductase [Glaciihabitans sp. dw_435]|uniref:SDR family NAD(P)-dependent oxidoreductase n=1 Tax=Glaciihabitans sp. dw_435 TaxID=2720081 RepID=UPI001BD43D2E|nr:SDR family NAD(P)-dependent oxidoreductase [Glaciihabitans sp. dw_435]